MLVFEKFCVRTKWIAPFYIFKVVLSSSSDFNLWILEKGQFSRHRNACAGLVLLWIQIKEIKMKNEGQTFEIGETRLFFQ